MGKYDQLRADCRAWAADMLTDGRHEYRSADVPAGGGYGCLDMVRIIEKSGAWEGVYFPDPDRPRFVLHAIVRNFPDTPTFVYTRDFYRIVKHFNLPWGES